MGNKSSLMLQDEEVMQISDKTGFSPSEIEKLYSRFSLLDRSNCGLLSKADLTSIPELAINPLCDRIIHIIFSDCGENERINFRQFARVLAIFRSSASVNNNSATNTPDILRISPSKDSKIIRQLHSGDEVTKHATISSIDMSDKKTSRDERRDTFVKHHRDSSMLEGINESLRRKLIFVFKVYDADDDGRIGFSDFKSILKMMVGNYIEDFQLDKISDRVFAELDDDNDGYIEFCDFCRVFSAKDLNNKLRVKFIS